MNLLMVNDEVMTVETMKTDIPWEQFGIDKVFTAYDADSAKACLRQNLVDLLLCDIEMPGENGIAILRWVRKQKMDVECIFLTCHASFQYAQEALQLGCQDYILMPAKYEEIGIAVRKAIDRIKARREVARYEDYGKQAIHEKLELTGEKTSQEKGAEIAERAVGLIVAGLSSEKLSVNEIAEKLYVHPVYLNRVFKKEKGISVSQYIIQERMRFAADLLRTKHQKASDVAELVGYRNYPNFSAMFTKYYGCPPSRYSEEKNTP